MRSVNELISKKREAVRLRLSGLSLAQVKARTDLSVPTIIKAVEQFKALGWQGLELAERGRKPIALNSALAEEQAILSCIALFNLRENRFCSVDGLLFVYGQEHKTVSRKTLLRRLSALLPERDQSALFSRMARFVETKVTSDRTSERFWTQCKKLVLGFDERSEGCVFYSLDRRGERRFVFLPRTSSERILSETSLVAQLDKLVQDASPEKPFFVVIKTDSLSRYRRLAAWQEVNRERCFLYAQWALPE